MSEQTLGDCVLMTGIVSPMTKRLFNIEPPRTDIQNCRVETLAHSHYSLAHVVCETLVNPRFTTHKCLR